VAWIGPYSKSRVVYIQLGHDRIAQQNPDYQELVHRAVLWAAGRLD
jgi:type 1 glutamine amidotransferase